MKNFIKILGVIALVAVIGVSMIPCGDDSDLNNNSDPSGDSNTDNNNNDTGNNGDNTESHSHTWGPWTATELAGTEERVCADGLHIEQRLTGTGRFTFSLIIGVAAYEVSSGTDIAGIVRIPDYYRPSDEVAFQPVTAIGSFYGCTSLTSIIIPEGVKEIGNGAFYGCSGLTSVTFAVGSQLQTIGAWAFYDCTNLTAITIPEGVKEIGNGAFYGCTNLTGITIPANVTSIGQEAFYGCTSLTAITIPEGVKEIGNGAFYGCTNLTGITFAVGSQLRTIGAGAFYDCTNLTGITIPANVTSMGQEAFYGCTSLISVTIPESVKEIGGQAFTGTAWLISQPDGILYINKILYTYKGTMPANTEINNIRLDTTVIAPFAFYGYADLTSITIPASVMSIGNSAFAGDVYRDIDGTLTGPYLATTISNKDEQGTHDGYNYELWRDSGTVIMVLQNGGNFYCEWGNIGNVLFRKGKKFNSTQTHGQIGKIQIDFEAQFTPGGNSYLCVYGWTKDPLVEYYIVENYGTHKPTGTSYGIANINGDSYELYETTKTNQPSIEGTKTFKQYWAVRQSKRSSGSIDVTGIFNAWHGAGLSMAGKMYEVALTVEGNQSNGNAKATKNILTIGGSSINSSNDGSSSNNNNNPMALTTVIFATGSNISNANFGYHAFPEGNYGYGNYNTLKTAYEIGKAGRYTRYSGGYIWTKEL